MPSRRSFLTGTVATGVALSMQRAATTVAQQKRVIVDSQVHLWPASTPERPWLPGAKPQLPEPFTIERIIPLMDEAGVDRVVIVPPVSLEGERIDYAQEAVKPYPGRFAIMARVALDKPDRAARLATWRDQAGVLGVRLNFGPGEAAWLTDGTADWFWPAAEKARLPVMFLTSGQTSLFARIAERHPQLTLIIDHMGVGAGLRPRSDSSDSIRNNAVPEAIAQSVALAKFANVSVKLSSVPLISTEPYPFRDVTPHIHRLFDAYGPERCHWGTDLTNSFARATYRQRVTEFTEELPFLTDSDKDWIMGRAILARLRWT
ncbi:amidohydrolase family protein [Bradyrhizobium sp. BEA-2-5]|uniref:amidohydrolase family protein n=1 Tax=Bradyrhizobium sp. BEA-2-5 TaxID=3080015 RepID=UPI00293E73D7|nr:amidohydrolase family protein [Bradyrhizobium sp. BEA-2-5]WOH79327.1 amidohydrolase family protein [Bradyrhizobium sp. BEA-2-5]